MMNNLVHGIVAGAYSKPGFLKFMTFSIGLLALLTIIVVQGCSLSIAANGTLPDSEKTIYVERFVNNTRVPGVDDQMTLAIKQEISSRGRLVVVSDKSDADLILTGTILYYGTAAKTTNAIAEPLDYVDTLTITAKLLDGKTKKVVWSTPGIASRGGSIPVISQAIIPTTPAMLQQNLRGQDLAKMPDMQVAATQQAVGKQRMMQSLASELYTDMAWGI